MPCRPMPAHAGSTAAHAGATLHRHRAVSEEVLEIGRTGGYEEASDMPGTPARRRRAAQRAGRLQNTRLGAAHLERSPQPSLQISRIQ